MVAVNNVALLAFSLASLSLSPSADAAAVRARSSPSDPGSPSKSSRQPASPLPMRMKRMVLESPGKRERAFDAMPKRLQKSRVVEVDTPLRKAFLKRKQDQATFHVSRRHVEARQDSSAASVPAGDQGRVDLMRGNTTVGHLVLNESNTPPTLDASNATATDSKTTLYLVRSESADASYCTLEMPASSNSTGPSCATFDPYPSQDEPLTMQPCFGNSTAPTARSTSLSQTFSYDPSTGFIAPVWDNSSSADNLDSRDTPESVTLVFVPTPSAGAAEANDRDSQSASVIATETVTTTVTATAIPSSSVDNGSSATDASMLPLPAPP
ncbi:hypothetical protein K438DRAFT_749024 [Mycena galopus ATCC 62051]|nr:hypothetical protein K438DRAFT_749024 [Mycena galopus ATCC 62051]